MTYKVMCYGYCNGRPKVLFLCNGKYLVECIFNLADMQNLTVFKQKMQQTLLDFKPTCAWLDAHSMPLWNTLGIPETGTI